MTGVHSIGEIRRRVRATTGAFGLEPRLIWVLGSARSGTTWLAGMLARATGAVVIDEPLIGAHLAVPFEALSGAAPDPSTPVISGITEAHRAYFFAPEAAPVWQPSLRSLLVRRLADAAASRRGNRRVPVIVKEPNGSLAAPVILRTLPRSRVIFLLRDGRDVVDSSLDGAAGGWISDAHGYTIGPEDRRSYLEWWAHHWVRTVVAVQRAYDAHAPDRRLRITYETLRAEPEAELRRLLGWLGREDRMPDVPRIVSDLSFERVPHEQRGSGRFTRSATPGLWQERFDTDEQALLWKIMGPTLTDMGYK